MHTIIKIHVKFNFFYRNLFATPNREKIIAEVKSIAESTSIVHFYFDSLGATKYERDKLFGTLDLIGKHLSKYIVVPICLSYFNLLAAFGGLVGLCSGFSIISLIEIIYWFSIRIIFNGILNRKK